MPTERIEWDSEHLQRFEEKLEKAIDSGTKKEVSRVISSFCKEVHGIQVLPYLLAIVRYFGYATKDDTWGEMWKRLAIMAGRRVELQTQVEALKSAMKQTVTEDKIKTELLPDTLRRIWSD